MKKWYRSKLCKGLLITAEHLLAAVIIICLAVGLTYPGRNYEDILFENEKKSYVETEGFGNEVFDSSIEILNYIGQKETFEAQGKYDETKVVDLETYKETRTISGVNESGLSYRLGDLVAWGEEQMYESSDRNIIVCELPDGKYQYFTFAQLKEIVTEKNLSLFYHDGDMETESTKELLKELEQEYYTGGDYVIARSENGEKMEVWNFGVDSSYEERFRPIDADSVLEIANENTHWNGRLKEMFDLIYYAVTDIRSRYEEYTATGNTYVEGNTNLSYLFVDLEAEKVYTNRAEYADYSKVQENIENMKQGRFAFVAPKLADFETNMEFSYGEENWIEIVKEHTTSEEQFQYIVSVDEDFPIHDFFYDNNESFRTYAPMMKSVLKIGVGSILLFLMLLVWLTVVAGRSNEKEGVALLFFDKWKTELTLAFIIACFFFAVSMLLSCDFFFYEFYDGGILTKKQLLAPEYAALGILGALGCAGFLTGYLSLVRVLKAGNIWRNSILKLLADGLKQVVKHMNSMWKLICCYGGFILLQLLGFMSGSGGFIFLCLGIDVFLFVALANRVIARKKIGEGLDRIASGDMNYKISTDKMKGEDLETAQKVNRIGDGIQRAVEKSMKDERLKTDLITNVSHDIKTPLTSIINYVGLLKQENFEDPKIQRYLDILDQKSQRLKALTEDVVEASKISSGNISLEFINLNLVELVHQTTGEFDEKFAKRNLQIVLNVPEEPAVIRVDGRRMWRVIENIYNNAAKYAMPGTRVYADMKLTPGTVEFSLKNVSEQPLNISADELTERFIRGDISRSTEGSGLGLSIAKSLTEMQGGRFELYLDGDLFKVTIRFPRIKGEKPKEETLEADQEA